LAVGSAQLGDMARWNPPDTVIGAESHPAYARQYPLFQRLYGQTRDIMAELG
jgi:xylulokinase